MAIKFQYNKTSLQQLNKQLKVRMNALPTIKSKESALRLEVKKAKDELFEIKTNYHHLIRDCDYMVKLWNEFDSSLLTIEHVDFETKKIAGVIVPVFKNISFSEKAYSYFNSPVWISDGISLLKEIATAGIKIEIIEMKLERLEYARKKTTQKVNLFEKVQIPGYNEAIIKIKRYLEDEDSLSKSSQKIMLANLEKNKRKEVVV